MKNYDELMMLKNYFEKLSKAIDPISELEFPNDTIINNIKIKDCFLSIVEIIDEILQTESNLIKKNRQGKTSFCITSEDKSSISLSDTPIPISTFVYNINSKINSVLIKKLKATQITYWLVNMGYLALKEHNDGKIFKVITDKAKEIGITAKPMENSYGRKYDVNLYDKNAQKFILDNIEQIVNDY